jgi:hypothetical protein
MKRTIPYNPKAVRLFLVVLLALVIFLTIKLGPRGTARVVLIGGEAAVVAILLALPKLFFPVFRILMVGSSYIGNAIFLIISTLVFFLILTPMSLIRTLLRKKFMPVAYDRAAPTYFEEPAKPGPVERQF